MPAFLVYTVSFRGLLADLPSFLLYQAGYREGIEPGKLSTLQAGFDSGFAASVGPSRRLGQLRGRTQVLVQLSSKSGGSSAQGTPSELGNRARALLSDLNRIKREQTLAVDHEAEAHARMEHPEDFPEDADGRPRSEKPSAVDEALGFVKEGSRREMEVLEDALERMSGGGGGGSGDKGGSELREGALLDAMERRVVELEVAFGLQSPTFK